MWAQKFRDCFPRGTPEPDPNAHLQDPHRRVRVGPYMVPPEAVEEYRARLAKKPPAAWPFSDER